MNSPSHNDLTLVEDSIDTSDVVLGVPSMIFSQSVVDALFPADSMVPDSLPALSQKKFTAPLVQNTASGSSAVGSLGVSGDWQKEARKVEDG